MDAAGVERVSVQGRLAADSSEALRVLAAWLVDADVAAGTLVAHLQSCWQEQTPFLLDGEVSGEPG